MTLQELQAKREKLAAAIATGYRRVQFGEGEVEFPDFDDMRARLAWLDHEISAASGSPAAGGVFQITTGRGLG